MRWFRIRKEHIPVLLVSVGVNVLIIIAFIGIGVYVFQAHGLSLIDDFLLRYVPELNSAVELKSATTTTSTSSMQQ